MGNIVIKNLSFKYTDYIFKDLNLNINDSWRLGLIARSGYKTIGDYNVNLPKDIFFIEQESTETKEFDRIFTQLSKPEKEKFLYLLYKLGMGKNNFYENRVNEWSDGEKNLHSALFTKKE